MTDNMTNVLQHGTNENGWLKPIVEIQTQKKKTTLLKIAHSMDNKYCISGFFRGRQISRFSSSGI